MPPILPTDAEAAALAVGPQSVAWQRASDARTLVGAGAALILQVAHPVVGAGVAEHSDFKTDPWGRLLRTLDYVNLLVYGGPQRAPEIARGVRAMHRQIKGTAADGTRYHALDPEAYAWVHATLALTIVGASQRFGRRLTDAQVAGFYAEWRDLGRLLGIRERDLPVTWPAFEAYVDQTVAERLRDNPTVRDVLQTIARPVPPPGIPVPQPVWQVARMPAARLLRLTTYDLLPATLRDRLGLRLSALERVELRALAAASRAASPVLPQALRQFGPPYLRWRGDRIWTASRLPSADRAAA